MHPSVLPVADTPERMMIALAYVDHRTYPITHGEVGAGYDHAEAV